MTKFHSMLLASAAAVVAGLGMTVSAQAADQILSGSIATAAGQKLDGVVVSAKREGSTITTSVYTDATGNYYFPPMAAGKYNIWAQTLGFEQTKAQVDLSANKKQDLALKTITDPETKWKQLPGELVWDALPEGNAEDVHMKQIIHNNCNGCHTPSYPLQFKFDEAGLEQDHRPDESHRWWSASGPSGQSDHSNESEAARGLSRQSTRTEQPDTDDPDTGASVRRSCPRRVDAL